MRYWHYLRESFESSLIYFSKWGSHKPQYVNIISNKLHHILQMTASQHMRVSAMKWELLLQSLELSALPFLCSNDYIAISIKSTLNMTLYIRRFYLFLQFSSFLRWRLIFTFLLRPFKTFSGRIVFYELGDTNIGKAWFSSKGWSVSFSRVDCENVRVSTISHWFLYLQSLVQWLHSISIC